MLKSKTPLLAGWECSTSLDMQLKVKISKRLAAKEQMQRRKNLTKYIPNAVAAIFPVLESMSQNDPAGTKRRLLQAILPSQIKALFCVCSKLNQLCAEWLLKAQRSVSIRQHTFVPLHS